LNIEVVTTIPELFDQFKEYGIIGRAIKTGKINFDVINLRNYAHDLHKTTDDYAYGTGVGMVMKVEPVFEMFDEYLKSHQRPWIVYPSPQGETFDQSKAFELSQKNDVMFICGRYEGVDERIMSIVDEEISIGDFVISGGEAITMVFVEAMARMIPGVVGKEVSVENDSFFSGLLDHANYTRPRSYRGMDVPEVLRSGDHAKVGKYLLKDAIKRTIEKRPDLFLKRDLSFEEKAAIIALLREKKEC
jgi:tRNA (guanine37-N1)-methyltransferase